MKELNGTKRINDKNSDDHLDQLLSKIEEGKIPPYLLLNQIFELVIRLNDKIDQLDEKIKLLPQLADAKRQIEEIHKLHFAKEHLGKKSSLKDKYLAEILIENLKKRR